MYSNLERYLNDHLSGSAGAVDLIGSLAHNSTDPADERYFKDLNAAVQKDREILRSLLRDLGDSESGILQALGNLTAKAGRLKLMWEGMEDGKLGLFEALEMLSLGIEGKRSLWRMLGTIAPSIPQWRNVDFAELAETAATQRDSVEARRIAAGEAALLVPDPR